MEGTWRSTLLQACHLDLTTRASGDCAFHGILVLWHLLVQKGLAPARLPSIGDDGAAPRDQDDAQDPSVMDEPIFGSVDGIAAWLDNFL